ncbi:amidohydrolase family protein [bacterium]|nr:amidohydrolase family protein [bacterium]
MSHSQHRRLRSFDTGEVVDLAWNGPLIEHVGRALETSGKNISWVAPGFVDLQVNGVAGVNFGDPEISREDFVRASSNLAQHGVTHFLPTLITDRADRMERALGRLAELAHDLSLAGAVLGFHLEGPYLSAEDGPRGAHPLAYTKDPDWDEFCRWQEAADGMIRMMTLAPERKGAIAFIEKATAAGVHIAIGHTAAKREQILSAVDAGATLSTHLGNAAHDRIQRHHNYIFDQLGDDRLWASLIVDGHHLPPHLVKIFVRAKGFDRIILVSDAVQYAGLPAGIYDGGHRQWEVRDDGFIGIVGEPRLAGSGLLLSRAIENFTSFLGEKVPAKAIACVTSHPRFWLSGETTEDWLARGQEASLVVYDWDMSAGRITIRETIRQGKVIFG